MEAPIRTLKEMREYASRRVEVYQRKLREWSIPGCTVSPETVKADRQARDVYQTHVEALTVAIEALLTAPVEGEQQTDKAFTRSDQPQLRACESDPRGEDRGR